MPKRKTLTVAEETHYKIVLLAAARRERIADWVDRELARAAEREEKRRERKLSAATRG